jgi:PRTRC genetic system protein B
MADTDVTTSESEGTSWEIASAILLYQAKDRSSVYATMHDVRTHAGKPVLGAGRPATKEACAEFAKSLGASASLSGFTPQNLLFLGGRCAIWWRPPGKGSVYFNCTRGPAGDQFYDKGGAKLLGKRSGITPHPGLVFAVCGREWYVFAVKGAARPGRTTPLFRSPYFNVWKEGKVCTGTTPLPNRLSADALDKYEQAFFGSNFTHANIKAPGKLVNFEAGPYAFWDCGLRGKWKAGFPVDVLIDRKLTLDGLASRLEKGKGFDNDWG